jgi:DMSO/TMAO reductase YedYZ heme-binding membrane subunit
MKQINQLLTSWNIVKTVLFITVVSAVLFFLLTGFDETTLRTAVKLTARMSGLLFSIAFIASSLHLLLHSSFSQWMLKNRRYIGVSFACVHLIHLGLIVSLQVVFETVIPNTKLFTMVGGGIAYVFVIAMLFTSFPLFSTKLSKRQWKLLHTVGGYWIWAVFLFSYLKRLKDDNIYIVLAIFFVAVLLVRLYKKRLKLSKLASG